MLKGKDNIKSTRTGGFMTRTHPSFHRPLQMKKQKQLLQWPMGTSLTKPKLGSTSWNPDPGTLAHSIMAQVQGQLPLLEQLFSLDTSKACIPTGKAYRQIERLTILCTEFLCTVTTDTREEDNSGQDT